MSAVSITWGKQEFSCVKQSIGTVSDGRVALIEQDIETGRIRARPLRVNERTGFIYPTEYEVKP